MSQLKRLAGDTAIYGISSILGKSINYLLVMLHTSVFLREELGVFTYLYAYVAFLNIIYTFGMETAFFRFINKSKSNDAYNTATSLVVTISTLISGLIYFQAESIAAFINFPGTGHLIEWLAIILWIDGIMAIPFALIRQQNKAKLFATVKVGNILLNVGLQLFFLLALPVMSQADGFGCSWYNPELGIGYIVLANLIANAMYFPMLWKYIVKIRIRFDWIQLKPMLIYAIPIVIMGLAGMVNEMLDKILIAHLLPDTFYSDMDSTAAIGVYGQIFKLSIFMMLAIQAFRYAGEPFFFSNAKDKNAPELFARVMHYFVLACLVILFVVSINIDLLALMFLRDPDYRVVLYLVPILLFGKLFYGIYVNLNVWFKLIDKTIYGTYFSLIGASVTILGNVLLLPVIGLVGCVVSSVLCYVTMCILCYIKGQKYYPIPYNFVKLLPHFIFTIAVVVLSFFVKHENFIIDSAIRILLTIIFVFTLVYIENPKRVKKQTDIS